MSRTVEQAYDFIYAEIATGRLRPGAHVPEERVAEALGTSRTPVREAIRRLEADGIVQLTRNSGADVVQPTAEEVTEIFRLRVMLEGLAAERAAARIGAPALEALEALADRLQAALRPGEAPDQLAASRLNAEFHLTVARAAESPRLLALIGGLVRLPPALLHSGEWGPRLVGARGVAEHGRIIEALRRRDADLARAEMQLHILAARPEAAPSAMEAALSSALR